MTAQNLAVCFAPSLFQLSSRLNTISPTRRHKTIGVAGFPSERELKENSAAQCCLSLMIDECKRLFTVPKSVFDRFYMDATLPSQSFEFPTLSELGRNDDGGGGVGVGNYRSFLLGECRDLLKVIVVFLISISFSIFIGSSRSMERMVHRDGHRRCRSVEQEVDMRCTSTAIFSCLDRYRGTAERVARTCVT